jgi:hypothetical protein
MKRDRFCEEAERSANVCKILKEGSERYLNVWRAKSSSALGLLCGTYRLLFSVSSSSFISSNIFLL